MQINNNIEIAVILNEKFDEKLAAAVHKKFDIAVKIEYDMFVKGDLTTRIDGGDFTVEQADFILAWTDGYKIATHIVYLGLQEENDV